MFGKWKVLLNSSSDPLSVSSLSRVISLLNECEVPSPELWAEILLRGTQAIDNKHDLVSIIQSLTYPNDSSYLSTIEKVQYTVSHNYINTFISLTKMYYILYMYIYMYTPPQWGYVLFQIEHTQHIRTVL